jgi:hypothetical protein
MENWTVETRSSWTPPLLCHLHSREGFYELDYFRSFNHSTLYSEQARPFSRLHSRRWAYHQPGLLCIPRNFAQSSKFLGKNIFWFSGYLWGIFEHFPNFKGHTSSRRHTNETLNLLTKLWSFKVIWTFFGALSWLRWAPVDGLTKNVVKQNV